MKALKLTAIGLALAVVTAAFAAPPNWRWAVASWDATSTNEVTLAGSTGGVVEWVRWNSIAGPTNTASASLTLISAADGYQTPLGTLSVSNASDAVSAESALITATNAQWRTGDRIRPSVTSVTNGTVAIGYWYYE